MTSPTLTYDRGANALYIRFSSNAIADTVELSESVYVDLDQQGDPVGFEVLHAEPGLLADLATVPDTAAFRDLVKRDAS
jgi:uncharacterized protein YuzE